MRHDQLHEIEIMIFDTPTNDRQDDGIERGAEAGARDGQRAHRVHILGQLIDDAQSTAAIARVCHNSSSSCARQDADAENAHEALKARLR